MLLVFTLNNAQARIFSIAPWGPLWASSENMSQDHRSVSPKAQLWQWWRWPRSRHLWITGPYFSSLLPHLPFPPQAAGTVPVHHFTETGLADVTKRSANPGHASSRSPPLWQETSGPHPASRNPPPWAVDNILFQFSCLQSSSPGPFPSHFVKDGAA